MVLGEIHGTRWFDRRVADSEAALGIWTKVRAEDLDGAETFAQDVDIDGVLSGWP
uniref:Uncharacterized protein n=1 Tax=Bionectria ochroleuca TaxID=29856 RepID=A0A8H7K961_BIOOC